MFHVPAFRCPHPAQSALFVLFLATLIAFCAPRAGAQNYLHTSGAQIVDADGHAVRLTGLNWFGLETSNYCPHGLWTRSIGSVLDQIKSLGYNCLRVPYCNQMFDSGSTPNGIDFSQNPDLQGLTPVQILDKLVAGCRARGLKVILDRHRPDSGGQSALWYTSQYSEQRWIGDWKTLASRYSGDDTVIGCDLHNEPHDPATWGSGDTSTDWRLAAERCGNAILAVNPRLLIIVEGIQTVNGDGYWWGGNLEAAGASPVRLSVSDQLVYSAHDYPSTVSGQPWFSATNYPANLPGVWDQHWGYLVKNAVAPVYVGEWGTLDQTTSDQQWFGALSNYIAANGLSFTFWCLNPDSGDTGGLLDDDWQTVHGDKQSVLQPLLAPLIGDGTEGGPTAPAAPTGLKAVAGNGKVTLSWNASAGAASYALYRGTASGAETALKAGLTATSYPDPAVTNGKTYYYTVAAVNSAGASARSSEASATPTTPGGPTVPAAPTGLKATAGNAKVALAWSAPAGTATGYFLYRAASPGAEGATPYKTGLTAAGYTDTAVTNGRTYYYTVAAANSAGTSPQSAEVSATPAAPTGGGTITVSGTVTSNSGPYWGEEDVSVSNTAPITALSVTITVRKTTGVSFNGQYDTVGSGITSSHTETTSQITYTFKLAPGQTLTAGTDRLFAAQFGGTGTAHPTPGDTYAVTETSGGHTATQTGHF